MDLIERQSNDMSVEEAIKVLEPFKLCMFDQYGYPISDAAIALDVAIKELKRMQWIPCKEHLPKKDDRYKDVLIQFEHNMAVGNYRVEELTWCVSSGDNWETPVLEGDGQPIAWMPLPERYGVK